MTFEGHVWLVIIFVSNHGLDPTTIAAERFRDVTMLKLQYFSSMVRVVDSHISGDLRSLYF